MKENMHTPPYEAPHKDVRFNLYLPQRNFLLGSVTRSRFIRTLQLYLFFLIVNAVIYMAFSDQHIQSFCLGLVFPGAGFIAVVDLTTWMGMFHVGMFILSVGMFCFSCLVWFSTGNIFAPLSTWMLLAMLSMLMDHVHVNHVSLWNLYALVFVFLSCVTCISFAYKKKKYQARLDKNKYLKKNGDTYVGSFTQDSGHEIKELSGEDVKRLRFILDRALQPVQNFDGFDKLDQFQTAALRYQLNFMGYALSMAQTNSLPALKGYIVEAQKRLIQKQAQYSVWGYWELENLWGNIRCNPDPIERDNIMFTGFCALQMAMYHQASGENDFLERDSFSLDHPSGYSFRYSLHQLVDKLGNGMQKSDFALMACEPNWIYPLCNAIGASAIKAVSPEIWENCSEKFRTGLEHEFITLSGQIIPCRSNYTGLALPMIGGAMPQAMPCFFLNALFPDIALRQWLLLRREIFVNGELVPHKFWKIDTGNYHFSRAAAYSAVALAAAELGDSEIKDACLQALDKEYPVKSADRFFRPDASIWSHAVELLARVTTKNSFKAFTEQGMTPVKTPHFNILDYPNILVAKASYRKNILEGVFYPADRHGLTEIRVSGLNPHRKYRYESNGEREVSANSEGDLVLRIPVTGRTEVHLYC